MLKQSLKAPTPMSETELPIVTEVGLLQSSNALAPMLLTKFGIMTVARPRQPSYLQPVVHQLVLVETVEKC